MLGAGGGWRESSELHDGAGETRGEMTSSARAALFLGD